MVFYFNICSFDFLNALAKYIYCSYLKTKHYLFYFYIMCICNVYLCSHFLITKLKL